MAQDNGLVRLMEGVWTIVSFNVNGLKSALRRSGFRELSEFLQSFDKDAEVVCIQEVKLGRQELQFDFCKPMNWEAYYSLSASTTATKKVFTAYSGVATFCRSPNARPLDAREGLAWVIDRITQRIEPSITEEDRLSSSGKRRRIVSADGAINTFQSGSFSLDELQEIEYVMSLDVKMRSWIRLSPSNQITLPGAPSFDVMSEHSLQDQLRALKQSAVKITHHGGVVIINVYCPALRAASDGYDELDPHRLTAKSDFHKLLILCVRELQRYSTSESLPSLQYNPPHHVRSISSAPRIIIAGDMNVKPYVQDSVDAEAWEDARSNFPFILQTETLLSSCKMVDSFRHLYPKVSGAFSCWSQLTGARITNYGSRIDLILVSNDFVSEGDKLGVCRPKLQDSWLMEKVFGSDHCPVAARFTFRDLLFSPSKKTPALCAQFLPEANHRQGTLFQTVKFVQKPKEDGKTKVFPLKKKQLSLDQLRKPAAARTPPVLINNATSVPFEIDLDSPLQRDRLSGDKGPSFEASIETSEAGSHDLSERMISEFCMVVLFTRTYQADVMERNKKTMTIERELNEVSVYVNLDDQRLNANNKDERNSSLKLIWLPELSTLVLECLHIPLMQNIHCPNWLLSIISSARDQGVPISLGETSNSNKSVETKQTISSRELAESLKFIHPNNKILPISTKTILSAYQILKEFCKNLTKLNIFQAHVFFLTKSVVLTLPQLEGVVLLDQMKMSGSHIIFVCLLSPESPPQHQQKQSISNEEQVVSAFLEASNVRTPEGYSNTQEGNILSSQTKRYIRSGLTVEDLLENVQFLSEKEQKMYIETASFAPLCHGHKLPCVKRKVKKAGPNFGREFWSCVLPDGAKGDPRGRCNTFQWGRAGVQIPEWAKTKAL